MKKSYGRSQKQNGLLLRHLITMISRSCTGCIETSAYSTISWPVSRHAFSWIAYRLCNLTAPVPAYSLCASPSDITSNEDRTLYQQVNEVTHCCTKHSSHAGSIEKGKPACRRLLWAYRVFFWAYRQCRVKRRGVILFLSFKGRCYLSLTDWLAYS